MLTCGTGKSCDQEGTMEGFRQSGNVLGNTDVCFLIIQTYTIIVCGHFVHLLYFIMKMIENKSVNFRA